MAVCRRGRRGRRGRAPPGAGRRDSQAPGPHTHTHAARAPAPRLQQAADRAQAGGEMRECGGRAWRPPACGPPARLPVRGRPSCREDCAHTPARGHEQVQRRAPHAGTHSASAGPGAWVGGLAIPAASVPYPAPAEPRDARTTLGRSPPPLTVQRSSHARARDAQAARRQQAWRRSRRSSILQCMRRSGPPCLCGGWLRWEAPSW